MGVDGILWCNTAEEHLKQEQNLKVNREPLWFDQFPQQK